MEASMKILTHIWWLGKNSAIAYCCILGPLVMNAQTEEPTYAQYLVTYLSIPILDTYQEISNDSGFTTVVYINQIKSFWATFQNVRNRYSATFSSAEFTPVSDEKEILEGNFKQALFAQYSEELGKVVYSNRQNSPWKKGQYSVLSAVHFLEQESSTLRYPYRLEIMLEGEVWAAQITNRGDEKLHIIGKSLNANHLHVVMQPQGGQSVLSRTDILMGFLSTAGSTLDLWIADNQQIVRVQVGEFPKAVVLELVKNGVNAMETD